MESQQQPQFYTLTVQHLKNDSRLFQPTQLNSNQEFNSPIKPVIYLELPRQSINQQIYDDEDQFNNSQQSLLSPFLFPHKFRKGCRHPNGRNHEKCLQIIFDRKYQNQQSQIYSNNRKNAAVTQQQNGTAQINDCSLAKKTSFTFQNANVNKQGLIIDKFTQDIRVDSNQSKAIQLNIDNVIDYFHQNNLNQRRQSRSVFNRKQKVAFNTKLKDILLDKYMLLDIPKVTSTAQKASKKDKKQLDKKTSKLGMRELLIKKLHKILRKKNFRHNQYSKYAFATRLLANLQQTHGICTLQFRRSFIKLIRQINDNFNLTLLQLQNQLNRQFDIESKSEVYQHQASSKAQESVYKQENQYVNTA